MRTHSEGAGSEITRTRERCYPNGTRDGLVLGINAAYHESAAAVVRAGKVLHAVEEERLSRVKHGKCALATNSDALPWRAIESCLRAVEADVEDLSAVAYSLVPGRRLATLGVDPEPIDNGHGFGTEAGELLFDERVRSVGESFPCPVEFVPHHVAHAAHAFCASPFPEAALLVVDGIGESSTCWLGRGGPSLQPIEEIRYPHSLGLLWERVALFLGFTEYDAPKVMGLAAYGDPERYEREIGKLLAVPSSDGGIPGTEPLPFYIDLELARFRSPDVDGLEFLFGPRRTQGEAPTESRFADVAAALQRQSEAALLALCRRLHHATGLDALAYAGGVALNCVANGRLEREGPFEALYIPSAPHDAGTALGAALVLSCGGVPVSYPPKPMDWALGPSWSLEAIDAALTKYDLEYIVVADPAREAARMVAGGQLVGWFRGAVEFGPRALGHRSLLADPRCFAARERLNSRIKHREGFRPFAASVLAEEANAWFALQNRIGAHHSRELMLVAYPARPDVLRRIPAVLHVDNTCRIQTVTPQGDPAFHRLIVCFAELTGVPMVLNTSFNDSEPIVGAPDDAIRTYLATGMDAVFLEDRLVRRSSCYPETDVAGESGGD